MRDEVEWKFKNLKSLHGNWWSKIDWPSKQS